MRLAAFEFATIESMEGPGTVAAEAAGAGMADAMIGLLGHAHNRFVSQSQVWQRPSMLKLANDGKSWSSVM